MPEQSWNNRWSVTVSQQNEGLHSFHKNFFDRPREYCKGDHGRIDIGGFPDGFDPAFVIPNTSHGAVSLSLTPKYAPKRPSTSMKKRSHPGHARKPVREWDSRHAKSVSSLNNTLHPHYRNWFDRPAEMGMGNPIPPRATKKRILSAARSRLRPAPWMLGNVAAPEVKDIEPERQESVSLENTALVVDDSPEVRERIMLVLKHRGCRAEGASNGLEALKKMRSKWYRVVFCDGRMPIMNGYDCVTRFRAWEAGHRFEEPRQHIVGLTCGEGEETEVELEMAIEAGMDDAISKLAPASEFLQCVLSVSLFSEPLPY